MRFRLQILFGVSFAVLVFSLAMPNIFLYTTRRTFRAEQIHFDSAITPKGFYQHVEDSLEERKALHFSARVYATSLGSPQNPYPNIMQTAPTNDGVRLEASSPTTLIMAVGSTNGNPSIFGLSSNFAPNTWHTLDVDISPGNLVSAWVDGKSTVRTSDPTLHYRIGEILVGAAFSGVRPFDGQIADAKLSYSFYSPRPYGKIVLTTMRVLFFVLGLILLYMLSVPSITTTKEGST